MAARDRPTARQRGIYSAGSLVTQIAIAACQKRGNEAAADLVHAAVADLVRLVIAGEIEDYNDRLDGFADTLGPALYRCFGDLEDDPHG